MFIQVDRNMIIPKKMNEDSVLFSEGEQTGFQNIYNTNFEMLCHYADSILKDRFIAEDIVADCFVKFWEDRKTIQINSNVKSYLLRSVKNKCIDHLRKHLRNNELQIEDGLDFLDLKSTVSFFKENDPLEIKELELKIKKAIDDLPDACRNIFILNRFNGMKYKEIAKELDISVNTVEVQMGRALQKLRLSLNEYLYILLVL